MSDPRKEPGFKNKRLEDRFMMILSAILDELIKMNALPVRRKAEKQEKAE